MMTRPLEEELRQCEGGLRDVERMLKDPCAVDFREDELLDHNYDEWLDVNGIRYDDSVYHEGEENEFFVLTFKSIADAETFKSRFLR